MSQLTTKLALASAALISQGVAAADGDWSVDSTYLTYVETDDRVSVNKTIASFDRQLDDGSVAITLVHDTMSGASPTGAIRSPDSAVTFTGASGRNGFVAGSGSDYSMSAFEDTRIQAGISREQSLNRSYTVSYGGVVSNEQDYESLGTSVGVKKEATDRLSSVNVEFAFTADTIYRSDTGDTPLPFGNTETSAALGQGKRNTYDALFGYTRVLNRRTVAQANFTVGLSEGYHSDPYKIISAADANDRIIANYHDSRPGSRLRTSLYGKVVHELEGPGNSIQASYRLYQDDWGIVSNTVEFRYHRLLDSKQYLEPHLRLYRQGEADFYYRKLDVDRGLNPLLPNDGFASADYRLDAMTSATLGLKYGFSFSEKADFRVRTEYIARQFDSADYATNDAYIVQFSFGYRF